jgi:hypothetical protein
MQAVADALIPIANIVMAWNTAQMQVVFDRWAERRSGAVSPTLVGRIAPTRTEDIVMRGIFRFPSKNMPTPCCRPGPPQKSMWWDNNRALARQRVFLTPVIAPKMRGPRIGRPKTISQRYDGEELGYIAAAISACTASGKLAGDGTPNTG